MRTSSECMAKADEMSAKADECLSADLRDEYLNLASQWRVAATEAARQDAHAQLDRSPSAPIGLR